MCSVLKSHTNMHLRGKLDEKCDCESTQNEFLEISFHFLVHN